MSAAGGEGKIYFSKHFVYIVLIIHLFVSKTVKNPVLAKKKSFKVLFKAKLEECPKFHPSILASEPK